jgi:hypothetical protein
LKDLSLTIHPVFDSQYNIKTIEGKMFEILEKFVSNEFRIARTLNKTFLTLLILITETLSR